MPRKSSKPDTRQVEAYTHSDKTRPNAPPAGLVTPDSDPQEDSKTYEYDPTLDPQLVWAGKKEHSEFQVPTVSLHVHERIEPSTILRAVKKKGGTVSTTLTFFEQPDQKLSAAKALEFYKHSQGWTNRLIAGDSLLVMNSLLEKEAMAGKVQMVFFDPPYGVAYGSNFQPFVDKRSAKDGKDEDLTQEPEMVKAFRDTWELGIHSYLSYIRDRALLAQQLLAATGSIFVQISEENVHHVREVLDEVFGPKNFVRQFTFVRGGAQTTSEPPQIADFLLWYVRDRDKAKINTVYLEDGGWVARAQDQWIEAPDGTRRRIKPHEYETATGRRFTHNKLESATGSEASRFKVDFEGETYVPTRGWSTNPEGMERLRAARRLLGIGKSLRFVAYLDDFPYSILTSLWDDTYESGFASERQYVVQTPRKIVQRCMMLCSDPGDLVLDPTCGSGTTALVAEQWGRRWIVIDTSRIALTIAKARVMTSPFEFYRLAHDNIGSGFQTLEVPRLTPKAIAATPGLTTGMSLEAIAALVRKHAPKERMVDRPVVDESKVRVSGPFTIEAVPAPIVRQLDATGDEDPRASKTTVRQSDWRAELLRTGIRGARGQHMKFSRLEPLAGHSFVHAIGEASDGSRVAVSFGPEFHPLPTNQVELALKEARLLDPKPALLVFAAFEFDPEASKDISQMPTKLAGMTLATAKMNSDLLTGELKKNRASNESFFFIGQPDVTLRQLKDGADKGKHVVEVHGYDYFDVVKGELVSGDTRKIAMWMMDPDYDDRSLYPHQVFFPMKDELRDWTRLAKNLKAELNEELLEKYTGTVSLPFELGKNQKVAVKIVDDRGIESMKVLTA